MAHASPTITALFAGLLALMILSLAVEEKIHAKKSVIVGVFAVVALLLASAFGLVHRETVEILGHPINLPVYIPGVDWEVIAIILGSSIFVDVTSKSGLFTWIAIRLTKLSGGDPLRLLIFYGVMTVVFSAVLNNVTAMIIVGTLSAVSLGKLGRPDKLLGFLLIEGLLTNVGGLLTLISSVPNIIVGNAAGISFVTFFIKASPYVAVATALTLWMGAKLFDIKPLQTDADRAEAAGLVAGFDENDGIESWGFFWFGAVMTGLFIAAMASASVTPWVRELGLGYVALAFASIMLVRYKAVADQFYRAVDWDLLAFFGCLFIVINMMEHALVLEAIGHLLAPVMALGETAGPGALLFASAVASSVTDNIPLAAMLAKILGGMGLPADSSFWWAVIFGANLGGNITPIGSASTLVAVTIIHKNKLPMSFMSFVKAAVPFATAQLVLAVAYVLLVLG
jgi:Na+/H+ antiporter NhaD/arsenite permease-like protein